MDKLRSGFGEMLRIAMRENNVTQEMLAKYLYTTQQTVSRWCKGICEPRHAHENMLVFRNDARRNVIVLGDGNGEAERGIELRQIIGSVSLTQILYKNFLSAY